MNDVTLHWVLTRNAGRIHHISIHISIEELGVYAILIEQRQTEGTLPFCSRWE
jgi:hypothetical protein